jgi:YebC/PmpR family DNA-binding regulatory protein
MGAQWKQKNREASANAKGRIFTKLAKEIMVAARNGADPNMNPRLRMAVDAAKKASMTKDTLERAIKKGAGLLDEAVQYETVTYEGFAPNQVPVIVECLTDNRNRAASEVRVAVTRNGGTMADPGSVAYLFSRKGVVIVPRESNGSAVTEDDLMLAVLDAGADEINDLGDVFEVVSDATDLVAVRTAVTDAGIEYDSADPTFIASVNIPLDVDGARKVIRLVDAIEDLDDVQNVYTNADISDAIAEQLDNE